LSFGQRKRNGFAGYAHRNFQVFIQSYIYRLLTPHARARARVCMCVWNICITLYIYIYICKIKFRFDDLRRLRAYETVPFNAPGCLQLDGSRIKCLYGSVLE